MAVCQVNVPGFPVTRARVASGHVFALVAAGTSLLNRKRMDSANEQISTLLERVDALEAPQRQALEDARSAAMARVAPVREQRQRSWPPSREAARERFLAVRAPEVIAARERVAAMMSDDGASSSATSALRRGRSGQAGQGDADGVFPISTVGDLKNAIRAYGRAKTADKPKVRRHIKKCASTLGKSEPWCPSRGPR